MTLRNRPCSTRVIMTWRPRNSIGIICQFAQLTPVFLFGTAGDAAVVTINERVSLFLLTPGGSMRSGSVLSLATPHTSAVLPGTGYGITSTMSA